MLSHFGRERKRSIIFAQETHISRVRQIEEWGRQFGGKCCWSLGSSHSRGVGITFHPSLDVKILNFKHDSDGRIIVVNIEYNSQHFRLVNVYCPTEPTERSHFIKGLGAYLRGASNIILGGDFNFVENSKLDKFGGNPIFGSIGHSEFSLLKQDFLLHDVFRQKYPSKIEATWDNGAVFCRLDRFYFSKYLLRQVRDIGHRRPRRQ